MDRFLCYKTRARQSVAVTLEDQFDSGDYAGTVVKSFCTPAEKDGGGIFDEETHLVAYRIEGPHSARAGIEVSNEFGVFRLDTKKVESLMVPSAKSIVPDPPPGLPDPSSQVDNYRCLRARLTRGAGGFPRDLKAQPLSVSDQFGARTVFLRKPAELCLPTDKNGGGIENPQVHLVCYKIKVDPRTSETGVQVKSSLGELALDLKREAELCVPSLRNPPARAREPEAPAP